MKRKQKENNIKSIHVKMKLELYETLNKDASDSKYYMNVVVDLLENKYLNNSNNITLEVIKNLIETCNIYSIN